MGGVTDVVSGSFKHTVNMQHKGQRMRAFVLLLDALVARIERRLMRWQPRAGETENLSPSRMDPLRRQLLAAMALVAGVNLVPVEGNPAMTYILGPVFSWPIVGLCVGTLVLVGLLAGILPARRAAAVDPVESLRYE